MLYLLFKLLIAIHITTGAPGLIAFWIPIAAKKGSIRHSWWGRFFSVAMLITATAACMMSLLSIYAPMETHPHLVSHPEFSDPELVTAIFGWMMLYLGILTLNLTWYGWQCAANKRDHKRNREWINWTLQAVLTIAAVNCAYRGLAIGQPMMVGISFVGFATVATNMWFLMKRTPGPVDWLLEHIKGIVGTGISVYTAFFAFGAVRLMPQLALAPALWAVPLVTGLAIIFYHRWKVSKRYAPKQKSAARRSQLDMSAAE
ncbi:MAG: hypothetical protein AAF724_01360 [Pseudomonadota bacterium]